MDDQRKEELRTSGKEIYDSIIIPPELSDIVKKTIESKDKESIDKQYKVLGSFAKVFTVRNYTVKRDELAINADVPNVELITADQIPEEKIPAVSVSDNEQPESDMNTEDHDISDNTVSGNMTSENTVSDNTVSENGTDMHMTISGNDIISVVGDEKKVVDTLNPSDVPVTVSGNDVYTQATMVNDFTLDMNKKIDSYVQKYISNETKRFEEYKTAFFETESLIIPLIMK